jgi:lipoate-protein ligase A
MTDTLCFEPGDASEPTRAAIRAALAAAPPDSDPAALAARIRAAIPFGVELVGTTPHALAAALAGPKPVQRIGAYTPADIDRLTESWRGLPWRILPEEPLSAVQNVALDEVLADRVAAGDRPPTLRFWGWAERAVVLGRCQSVANEVAPDAPLAVARRMTGGGAMFVEPHGAITYSLYLPEAAVAGLTIRQSYEVCDAWVVRGLRSLGVDAHHVPVNDIACADGKIGGAAQARRRGVVLHHATLAYDMDPADMARVLRVGRAKLRDRGVASAAKTVSPLTRQSRLPRAAVVAALTRTFCDSYGGCADRLTPAEHAAAEALAAAKYGTAAWTRDFE